MHRETTLAATTVDSLFRVQGDPCTTQQHPQLSSPPPSLRQRYSLDCPPCPLSNAVPFHQLHRRTYRPEVSGHPSSLVAPTLFVSLPQSFDIAQHTTFDTEIAGRTVPAPSWTGDATNLPHLRSSLHVDLLGLQPPAWHRLLQPLQILLDSPLT